MDFAFSGEQEMLRTSARDYLADRFPFDRVIGLVDGEPGWDPGSWAQLAEMGWLDPDLGFLEHAVLFEETGSALLPAPYFSTVGLAWPALPDDLRQAVAAGERSATVAWAEPGAVHSLRDADRVQVAADAEGRVTGEKRFVPDAGIVSDLVVVARGPQGIGLYAVEASAATVTVRSTSDRSRQLADVRFDAVPARPLAAGEEALAALESARLRALAALSCEAVGVAQRALDISAEHAKTRQQFGRVIGTYQGVSHRIANIYVALQLARSLAYWAAWCVAEGDEQAAVACAAAKSSAGEAAVFACENAIQAMGGIGFTWAHPLHRYYKRAQWVDAFEGFGRRQRADIAAHLLDRSA